MRRCLTGVDIFKLFAALGIVAIHTKLPLLSIIGRLGVPFFATVSSYFFFNKFLNLKFREEKKRYLKKFCLRISYLFLIWQVFYIPFLLLNSKKFFISRGINLKSLIEYIVNFFYPIPPNVNGWAPSWYLIAMALGIPVFVAIINSLNRNFIVIGIISMLIEIYYILADEFGFITHLPTWGIWSFPRLFVYIFCGFLIAKYYDKILVVKIRYYLILAIASILIFTCEYAVIESISHNSNLCETITIVPTSFIICCLSIKWMPKVGSTLRIRNFSTFLYCYQWFPLRFLGKVRILHYVSFVNFSVIIVTALILFYVYNKLYKRKGLNFFKYAV